MHIPHRRYITIICLILASFTISACSEEPQNHNSEQPATQVPDQDTDQPAGEDSYIPAPVIAVTRYSQTDPIEYVSYDQCSHYEPNFHSFALSDSYNELNVGPVAIYWGNDYSRLDASTRSALSLLKTDASAQQNVKNSINEMIRILKQKYRLDITPSTSAVNGKCYRVNLYFYGTGLWENDTITNYGGGTRCEGYSSVPNPLKIPTIEVPAGELRQMTLSQDSAIPFTLAHEYLHTVQCKSNRHSAGWAWYVESMAQFFANDVTNGNIFSEGIVNENFLALDAFFNRYAGSPFWIYVRHEYGDEYMGDIVKRKIKPNESLMHYLQRTAPVDCAVDDTNCRSAAFANLYGRFAASSVNFVASSKDEGVEYTRLYKASAKHRFSAQMQKVADKRYRISDWLAPQRYAHNIIELVPDPDSRLLSIKMDGWKIPERDTQWRVTIVATLDDASFPREEAWGETFMSGTQHIDLNEWEARLGKSIKKLHVAVAAVPHNWKLDTELSGFSNSSRHRELDRYVYELTIDGAWPLGHEPESLRPATVAVGTVHNNGGGFIAASAYVSPTAYVGPQARVLENAQVLDNARVEGRAVVRGNAIIRHDAIVSSNVEINGNARVNNFATVRDNILMGDEASVSAEGKLLGDTYIYGSFSMTGKAASIGAPLLWTTSGLTLSGTAIINGHEWLSTASYSKGTPYDWWTSNDDGVFFHYDFSEAHPYRIKDAQVSSDAYYLAANGKKGNPPTFTMDNELASQVLVLNGNGYLEMPKLTFDMRSYQLELLLKWQGNSIEYILDSRTSRGEQLAVNIIPAGSGRYILKLIYKDRNLIIREVQLQNAILQRNQWVNLAISYDDATSMMKLTANPLAGIPVIEVSVVLPSSSREFEYDTVSIRLGSGTAGTQLLNAEIDDVKLLR